MQGVEKYSTANMFFAASFEFAAGLVFTRYKTRSLSQDEHIITQIRVGIVFWSRCVVPSTAIRSPRRGRRLSAARSEDDFVGGL